MVNTINLSKGGKTMLMDSSLNKANETLFKLRSEIEQLKKIRKMSIKIISELSLERAWMLSELKEKKNG